MNRKIILFSLLVLVFISAISFVNAEEFNKPTTTSWFQKLINFVTSLFKVNGGVV